MNESNVVYKYDAYRPVVADIKNAVGDYQRIGEGAESLVWRVQLENGSLAVKIAKAGVLNARGNVKDRELMTKWEITSGIRALGIEGLEQLVAGSSEDYAAIFQFVTGVRLTRFTDDDVDTVTPEQREKLFETVARATEAGLVFDSANPSGANAFYSTYGGFTLIDYELANRRANYAENWSAAMRSLGPVALRAFAPRAPGVFSE